MDGLFPLNLPTLMVVTVLVVAFSGALLISARRPGSRQDPASLWGGSMLVGAVGFTLSAVFPNTAWIGEGLGTALLLAAVALSWVGACRFAEAPLLWWLAAAGPALWLATVPLQLRADWPGGHADFVAFACLIGAAYTVAVAEALWRTRSENLPSRRPALLLLLLHGAVYAARGAAALWGIDTRAEAGVIVTWLLMESLLHTLGMAFLLLAMMKERAELRSSRQLRALTLLDGLTGIGNRRHLDEQLEVEVRRAVRAGTTLALLMIDVDQFKRFNDEFGHPAGDECLRDVGKTLRRTVHRPRDVVARYGGEEFVVLLPDTDLAGAMHVAEAIRADVEALGVVHPGGALGSRVVTVSVGAAVLGADRDGGALVKAADRAMYAAKVAGRNRVCAAPIMVRPELTAGAFD